MDISLGNQLPDLLVQGQGRSSCPSVRGWPPWEGSHPLETICLVTVLLARASPLRGHPQRTGQRDPREMKSEDQLAVTRRRPGVGGGMLEPGLASKGPAWP